MTESYIKAYLPTDQSALIVDKDSIEKKAVFQKIERFGNLLRVPVDLQEIEIVPEVKARVNFVEVSGFEGIDDGQKLLSVDGLERIFPYCNADDGICVEVEEREIGFEGNIAALLYIEGRVFLVDDMRYITIEHIIVFLLELELRDCFAIPVFHLGIRLCQQPIDRGIGLIRISRQTTPSREHRRSGLFVGQLRI